jgi:TPR repeat protein
MDIIDDVTFVNEIDIDVGKLYSEAKKALSLDVPQHTLTLGRSISNMICEKVARHKDVNFPNDNLAENISILVKMQIINPSIKDMFHQLRKSGNKGAHPEQYNQSHKDFVNEAEQALELCCELISDYKLQFFGGSIPKYQYKKVGIDSKDKELKELAYRAVIQGEEKSLYEMGMYLKKKYDCSKEETTATQLGFMREQFMSYLNLSAIQHYPPALYENGLAHLSQATGDYKKKRALGLGDIQYAAELGHIEALALFGKLEYFGNTELDLAVDKDSAVSNLSIAANHDHPEALTILADHYIAKKDYKKARSMLATAVEAGYPLAKIRLAEAYLQNQSLCKDPDEVEEWLRAIDGNKIPESKFILAKWLIKNKCSPKNLNYAISVFENYDYRYDKINFELLSEAADILSKKPFDDNALPVAAVLACEAFQRSENPSVLRKKAYEQAYKIGRRIIRVIKLSKTTPKLIIELTRLQIFFDDKGKPLADLRQVMIKRQFMK